MPDISKCKNANCVMKNKCYRYVCIADKIGESYSYFLPVVNKIENFKCEFFMKLNLTNNV